MNTSSAPSSDRKITDPPGINNRCKPPSIAKTRWVAYAAAGAATALAGSQSAEAAIHYSGILDVRFPSGNICHDFPLDQPGDTLSLCHEIFYGFLDRGAFRPFGIASAAFRGFSAGQAHHRYVSQLHFGQKIAAGPFTADIDGGKFPHYAQSGSGSWQQPGIGFIGFRFNSGAGIQYGWVRIKVSGVPTNAFTLHDYAYADVGEPIMAGQTSENTPTPTPNPIPTPRPRPTPYPRPSAEQAPAQGSLGGLALGAVGLLAWRKSRKSLTARLEDA